MIVWARAPAPGPIHAKQDKEMVSTMSDRMRITASPKWIASRQRGEKTIIITDTDECNAICQAICGLTKS
jgi:hypothetical protein